MMVQNTTQTEFTPDEDNIRMMLTCKVYCAFIVVYLQIKIVSIDLYDEHPRQLRHWH